MNNKITSSQRSQVRQPPSKGTIFSKAGNATFDSEKSQFAQQQPKPPDEKSQLIYDLMDLNGKQQQRPLNLKKTSIQKFPQKSSLPHSAFQQAPPTGLTHDDNSNSLATQATTQYFRHTGVSDQMPLTTSQFGFDHSERSTTAATTFPQLGFISQTVLKGKQSFLQQQEPPKGQSFQGQNPQNQIKLGFRNQSRSNLPDTSVMSANVGGGKAFSHVTSLGESAQLIIKGKNVNSFEKEAPLKALDNSMIQDIKKGAAVADQMVQNSNPHSPAQKRKLSLVNPHRNNMKAFQNPLVDQSIQDSANRDIIIRKILPHQQVYKNQVGVPEPNKGANTVRNQSNEQSFFSNFNRKEEEKKLSDSNHEEAKKDVNNSIFDIGFQFSAEPNVVRNLGKHIETKRQKNLDILEEESNSSRSLVMIKYASKQSQKTLNLMKKVSDSNSSSDSPILTKFKSQLASSETFSLMYKKIKDGVVAKSSEDYLKFIENMGKIAGLSREQTEECIRKLERKSGSDRFHNPYLKKSNSSNESIEEDIKSVSSVNKSLSQINGGLGRGISRQPSNSGSSNWTLQGIKSKHHGVCSSNSFIALKGQYDSQSLILPPHDQMKQEKSQYHSSNKVSETSSISTSRVQKKGGSNKSGANKGNQENNSGNLVLPQVKEQGKAKSQQRVLLQQMQKPNQGQEEQKGGHFLQPHFNLNGQKAFFVKEKAQQVQGNLVKWKEGRKIGSGSSGEVYEALNVKTGALMAVKKLQIVYINSGVDKEAINKLKKEIAIYRKLDHENIIKYIGSEIVNNQFCIYLEYLAGGSIHSIYQKQGRLAEGTMKDYTRQILKGLSYLHSNGVVHCDLKGANVLVDSDGRVKLSDFGCSKLLETSLSQSEFSSIVRGSFAWMAPEILLNKGIHRRADIWSLGCLLIEMAVAGNPWGNETFDNNFQAILKIADHSSLPPVPEWLSPACRDFILTCLQRDYQKRPTAQQLQDHPWLRKTV